MKSTDELKKEHRAIEQMLQILEAVAARMEQGERLEVADLEGIVEFLTTFADKCHHGKEEGILFPAMEAAGIAREGGPIGVMLWEHDKGRSIIQRMREALEGCKSNRAAAPAEFAAAAREYIALLIPHIAKEDRVLYPMAEGRITPEKDDEIMAACEQLEENRIGAGKHEAFHRLLDHLKEKYLK